jgi:XTP/dITP diphosphohydrolase
LIVLGTHNQKKLHELRILLESHPLNARSLSEFPNSIKVEETGNSFAENAALKASVQAQHLVQWVLGEDSGLCVDALNHQPGVYSSRFAGGDATDESNNLLLLDRLCSVSLSDRTAYYVCHMALADPSGAIRATAAGQCRGRILFQPAGQSGFGYDPLFEIPEYHQTFGQLGETVKSVLSHRARAYRILIPKLLNVMS